MARRRKKTEAPSGGNWLDTYADMVTLLLTFFVLLYASSSIDEQKWQQILQAFESWGGYTNKIVTDEPINSDSSEDDYIPPDVEEPLKDGELPSTFDQLYEYLQNYVDKNKLNDSVTVDKGASHVYLRFQNRIFFNGDSAVLLDNGKEILDGLSEGINSVEHLILSVRVNGHTAEYALSPVDGWQLSASRANNVRAYLSDMGVLSPERYSVGAFGKYRPIDTNDTEEHRQSNRRVEIIVLRNDVDFSDPDIYKELFELEYGVEMFDPEEVPADKDTDKDSNKDSDEITSE